jgi:membrane-associated protein
VNYAAGRYVGPRVFREQATQGFWHKALNREHLSHAHEAFERFGGNAIVLGRFAPIIRTFVPFVAGAVSMSYSKFAFYNVTGGILWVGACAGAGYAFGNAPIVRNNFSLLVVAVIIISLIPAVVQVLRHRRVVPPAA